MGRLEINTTRLEAIAETEARKYATHVHGELNDHNREVWYETASNYEQGFIEGFRVSTKTPMNLLELVRVSS
jgi:hypothetical protein